MPLEFPSSPVDGQVYDQWIYSSSKGAWLAKPLEPTTAVTSDTPPANPIDGDMWFNTVDGTTYVWYDDGNTAQWVEMVAPISANGYYSPNYVINGGFDIWQRGTTFNSFGSTSVYTADRFYGYRQALAAGLTISRQPSSVAGTQYCARVQRDSGNTSTQGTNLICDLETPMSTQLAGKTITLSFYARAGVNFSSTGNQMYLQFATGTGTDQALRSGYTGQIASATVCTLSTSWQRFTFTTTIPSNATQMGFIFQNIPVGTAGANDYFEVTGVQLEEGSVATPFRRNANSIQGELAACQRYYFRLGDPNIGGQSFTYYGMARINSATIAEANIKHPVPMRKTATSIEILNTITSDQTNANVTVTGASISTGQSDIHQTHINLTYASGGTGGRMGWFMRNGSSPSYFAVSAEL